MIIARYVALRITNCFVSYVFVRNPKGGVCTYAIGYTCRKGEDVAVKPMSERL